MDDDELSEVDVEPNHENQPSDDEVQQEAAERLTQLFKENPTTVYYGRQLEVLLEKDYFHWITNRALRALGEGPVTLESHELEHASPTTLAWNRRYRYPRKQVAQVLKLINQYVTPEVSHAVGDRGEDLVLDGFARNQFVCLGRGINALEGRSWTRTRHNLDFVFQRDDIRYGVEVKNTLAYPDKREFDTKIELCEHLELIPVFVCRALPKSWIWELRQRGGFSLVLRWQLYPPLLKELTAELRSRFSLPVDVPRRLEDGTMARFTSWHSTRSRGA